MSTILDALRRAEQERQRGTVPTLHGPSSVLAAPAPGGSRRPWRGAAWLVLAVGAAALAGWWAQARRAQAPSVAVAPAAAPAPPSAAETPAAPPRPATAKAPARPAPPPPAHPQPKPLAGPGAFAPAAAPAPKASAAPAQAASAGPVFAPADLPASVRAELPGLHVAGITWSANPRLRMAIVNGQVLHEGDAAAPGMVLQAIEPARTVWAFRGYRIALASE